MPKNIRSTLKIKEATVWDKKTGPSFYVVRYHRFDDRDWYLGEDSLVEDFEDAKAMDFQEAKDYADDFIDGLFIENEVPSYILEEMAEDEKKDYDDWNELAKSSCGLVDDYPARRYILDNMEVVPIYANFQESKKFSEHYDPDLLDELVNYYASFDTMSTAEIWEEIYARYKDENLADEVIESLENDNPYDQEDEDFYEDPFDESKVRESNENFKCLHEDPELLEAVNLAHWEDSKVGDVILTDNWTPNIDGKGYYVYVGYQHGRGCRNMEPKVKVKAYEVASYFRKKFNVEPIVKNVWNNYDMYLVIAVINNFNESKFRESEDKENALKLDWNSISIGKAYTRLGCKVFIIDKDKDTIKYQLLGFSNYDQPNTIISMTKEEFYDEDINSFGYFIKESKMRESEEEPTRDGLKAKVRQMMINSMKDEEWEPEDKELWKSIDWKARDYKEYVVPGTEYEGSTYFYTDDGPEIVKEIYAKRLRANPYFPPYYGPIDNVSTEKWTSASYDGRHKDGYNVHDRRETWGIYRALSEKRQLDEDFRYNHTKPRESKLREADYKDIPLIDRFEFTDNKPRRVFPLPGINDISGFIKAAEKVGKERFKVRSTRVSFSNADIRDSWLDLQRKGWSVQKGIDDSLPGFNEVYIFLKIKDRMEEFKMNESRRMKEADRENFPYFITVKDLTEDGSEIDFFFDCLPHMLQDELVFPGQVTYEYKDPRTVRIFFKDKQAFIDFASDIDRSLFEVKLYNKAPIEEKKSSQSKDKKLREGNSITVDFACGPGSITEAHSNYYDCYESEESIYDPGTASAIEDMARSRDWNENLAEYYGGDGLYAIYFKEMMEIDRGYYMVWQVTYDPRLVSEEQIKSYLAGQMSDGWGEGFEQHSFGEDYDEEDVELEDEDEDGNISYYNDTAETKIEYFYSPWNSRTFEVINLNEEM